MLKSLKDILVNNLTITVIVGSVAYNLSLEGLLEAGNSTANILVWRGILSFFITSLLAYTTKSTILPQNWGAQMVRMVSSGVSLYMVFESFKYLAASTVAVISRLDIPFTALTPVIIGKVLWGWKASIATLSVALVGLMVLLADGIHEGAEGLYLAIGATLLVSVNFLLVKRDANVESRWAILNTTNIGCLAVGLLVGLSESSLTWLDLSSVWLIMVASLSQVMLNFVLVEIYKIFHADVGRRPYLIAAVVLIVAEQVLEHKWFDTLHLVFLFGSIILGYFLTMEQNPITQPASLLDFRLKHKE